MKGFYLQISRMEDPFVVVLETMQKKKEHI